MSIRPLSLPLASPSHLDTPSHHILKWGRRALFFLNSLLPSDTDGVMRIDLPDQNHTPAYQPRAYAQEINNEEGRAVEIAYSEGGQTTEIFTVDVGGEQCQVNPVKTESFWILDLPGPRAAEVKHYQVLNAAANQFLPLAKCREQFEALSKSN